jgi:NhaP-type Na+/H+ or K+/H+ antiporter
LEIGHFSYIVVGGISVGLAVGWLVAWVRRRVMNDGPEIVLTVSLLTPFVSYLAGEMAQVSSVLAVVTTGLYLGRNAPEIANPAVRLQSRAVWEAIVYLLNGMVFVLIGLQLPGILHHMREHWWPRPYLYAVAITLACILIRLAWVFPGAYLPRLLSKRIRQREAVPEWREVFIVGWAGMRGVVSLAAALALNGYPEFPRGHLTQFIAFSVILGTLVFQGLFAAHAYQLPRPKR